MTPNQNPYDIVPYQSEIIPNSSPQHLAICSLYHHGPRPKSQEFKVLELGCGNGANLIPMAFYQPSCTFVGIDNSAKHLQRARDTATQLGLKNISFELQDVEYMSAHDNDCYDYILAHGLFSWVSKKAQESILRFCSNALTPTGLAYICFNAMPGWGIRGLIRDLLLKTPHITNAPIETQAQLGMTFLKQIREDFHSQEYPFGALLCSELDFILNNKPFYLQHEYLTQYNHAFWLKDFTSLATRFNLDYVADAQFCKDEGQVPASLVQVLNKRPLERIEKEERIDLYCFRSLHAAIICKSDAPKTHLSHVDLLSECFVATSLSAQNNPFELQQGSVELFDGSNQKEFGTDQSITKAALLHLGTNWPCGLRLDSLFREAETVLQQHGHEIAADAKDTLYQEILQLYQMGQVHLRVHKTITTANPPTESIDAHPLAQLEISSSVFSTPYHLPLPLTKEFVEILKKLNGTQCIDSLSQEMGLTSTGNIISILHRWGLLEPHKPQGQNH